MLGDVTMPEPALYSLQAALEGERVHAPLREQISVLTNISDISYMISYADDQVIAISTVLDYFDSAEDERLKGSRVAALIYWKQALKNLKNRINQLRAESKKEKD